MSSVALMSGDRGPLAALRRRPVVAAVVLLAVVVALVAVVIAVRWPTGSGNQVPAGPAASTPPGPPPDTVLAVKIDNLRQARPQHGLTAADLVYVEPVEGGLSRLVALFTSRLPEIVGPVRSARETDLGLLAQFGRPVLGFSGCAPELRPQLDLAPVVQAAPAQAPGAYFQDRTRPADHDLFARPRELLAAVSTVEGDSGLGLPFGSAPPDGTPTRQYSARYPAAAVGFEWAPEPGLWLVSMDGAPLSAAEGGRLAASTVVVQQVTVRDSTISDVRGAVSPFAETVGSGDAVVLRDGQSYQTRWTRPTMDSGTTYQLKSGVAMTFAAGPVWVVLVGR